MTKVFKKLGKYLKYDEYTTHTGTHRKAEWVDDLQMATVFYSILPLHLRQSDELQGAEELEATETRTVTLTPNVERNRPVGGFSPEGPVHGDVGPQGEK